MQRRQTDFCHPLAAERMAQVISSMLAESQPADSERQLNSVDSLLTTKFSQLSDCEKKLIKATGPQKPTLQICSQGRQNYRHFSSTWYDKYEWLTGCSMRNKLFCFYCLCFTPSGSSSCADTFSKSGYSDMKNLSRALKRHAESKSHISAAIAYKSFGRLDIRSSLNEGFRQSVIQHNSLVSKNREILRRLIDVVELLARQELSFRAHDEKASSQNKGNYIEVIDFLASYDSVLRDHLNSSSMFKGTSKHVQA